MNCIVVHTSSDCLGNDINSSVIHSVKHLYNIVIGVCRVILIYKAVHMLLK